MLTRLLSNGLSGFQIVEFLLNIVAVMLSLTFHELSHGFVAWKLGDPTAKNAGRLTLNPLKHLDPLGAICMLLFRFGWAKPVPVSVMYFKNPRRDMAYVAAAGPVANILFGLVSLFLYYLAALYLPEIVVVDYLLSFLATLTVLNVGFAVFNLLPLPPLDGSRIAGLFLPQNWYWTLLRYERYIQIAVLILLYTGMLTTPLGIVRNLILSGMEGFVRWILL